MDILMSEILSSLIFGLLGIVILMIGYKVTDFVIPADLNKEIEKGNMSAGIVVAGMLVAIALIVSFAIR